MKKILVVLLGIIVIVVFSGCATFVTEKADLSKSPKGVRVYPPKIYLLVNGGEDTDEPSITIITLPDYERAYDIKPVTIFAKHTFKVEMEDGQLKTITSDEDTTAFLTFMTGAATLAAKAAGAPLSKEDISGTLGLAEGIYRLDDDGVFRPYRLDDEGFFRPAGIK